MRDIYRTGGEAEFQAHIKRIEEAAVDSIYTGLMLRGTNEWTELLVKEKASNFVTSLLTSVDAATGATRFSERVPLGSVFASPVGAAGRVYLVGRDGKALVLAAGPKLTILAENQLDDGFDASPVVVGGDLYLRGRRYLYALAQTTPR